MKDVNKSFSYHNISQHIHLHPPLNPHPPNLGLEPIPEKKNHNSPLTEPLQELPSRAFFRKARNSPPTRVPIVLWPAVARQSVLDNLMSGAGHLHLGRISQMANYAYLREGRAGCGREGPGGKSGATEGKHFG